MARNGAQVPYRRVWALCAFHALAIMLRAATREPPDENRPPRGRCRRQTRLASFPVPQITSAEPPDRDSIARRATIIVGPRAPQAPTYFETTAHGFTAKTVAQKRTGSELNPRSVRL
jgi:hypothetical protein